MTDLRSRPTRPLLFGLTVFLLAALLAPPAQATWPGRAGPIVYAAVNPGPEDDLPVHAGLRSFTPGAAGSRAQLTTDPTDRDPQVSPNGRLVVFSRVVRRELSFEISRIFVIGIDGSGIGQLTEDDPATGSDSEPTFDASGKRVLFVHAGDIYSIGLDGSGRTPITSGPPNDRYPAASPSGRQVIFVRNSYRPDGTESRSPHIYSMRPDGSRLRDLTPGLPSEQAPWDPEFSPSGRVIAYATNGNQLRGDIFTLRSNGGPIRRLTNRPRRDDPTFPRPYGYTNPAFSPDGDSILAVARSGTSPRVARIRLADPDHPRLFPPSIAGSAPAWAPRP